MTTKKQIDKTTFSGETKGSPCYVKPTMNGPPAVCLIRWSNKRDNKKRWFLAEKIWCSKLEEGHEGICLFVLEATKNRRGKKNPENSCSYNVDTETMRIVYLNLYKHCVFPCSIILNVKGILASRGLMCRDAHVKTPHMEDKQYLPGFGFMNNVIFVLVFFCVCKGP